VRLSRRPVPTDSLEARGVPVPIVDDVADDVTDRAAHFDFAHDGTLICLSRDAVTSDRTIASLDRSREVEPLLDALGRDTFLFPSPDGRKLAFVSGQDIWVLDSCPPSKDDPQVEESRSPSHLWFDRRVLVSSLKSRSATRTFKDYLFFGTCVRTFGTQVRGHETREHERR
jgi:WD40 repeat protein